MKLIKKLKKTHNIFVSFITKTIKNYKLMKNQLNKIWALILLTVIICSCGSTKVTVSKPAEGTSTTITVTTNNPISTNVNPETNLNK